jgi:hypothetical protein
VFFSRKREAKVSFQSFQESCNFANNETFEMIQGFVMLNIIRVVLIQVKVKNDQSPDLKLTEILTDLFNCILPRLGQTGQTFEYSKQNMANADVIMDLMDKSVTKVKISQEDFEILEFRLRFLQHNFSVYMMILHGMIKKILFTILSYCRQEHNKKTMLEEERSKLQDIMDIAKPIYKKTLELDPETESEKFVKTLEDILKKMMLLTQGSGALCFYSLNASNYNTNQTPPPPSSKKRTKWTKK